MQSSLPPPPLVEKFTRSYAASADDARRLDVYSVAGARAEPVVVFVHGGGLTEGDRSWYRSVGRFLARHGYVGVVPSYRLYPHASVFDAIRDVRSATAWARLHASEFGGDPQRIVLVGHSAGGWLVDLVLMDRALWARTPWNHAPVRAEVYLSGDYADIRYPAPGESRHDRALDSAILGPPGAARSKASPDSYPVAHVPWLLVCATHDDPGTCADRDAFATALRHNAVPVTTFTDRGSHMGEVTHFHTERSALWTAFASWLAKVLQP